METDEDLWPSWLKTEKGKQHAYDALYLDDNINVHSLLFSKFNEVEQYSVYSMIDTYMQTSEIRKKMDVGNWSALNKGYKQLFNSADYSQCEKRNANDYEEADWILLEWIATIYVIMQWKYIIPSEKINQAIPSLQLAHYYHPLSETSHLNACEKLFNKYKEIKEWHIII